jgi:hypothetical protein
MMKRGWLALLLVCGCGGAGDGGGSADLASPTADLAAHNPHNPAGAGPAAVNIGSATALGSAGSYVLLAKTEISSVTVAPVRCSFLRRM